jgi:hypothetical protein
MYIVPSLVSTEPILRRQIITMSSLILDLWLLKGVANYGLQNLTYVYKRFRKLVKLQFAKFDIHPTLTFIFTFYFNVWITIIRVVTQFLANRRKINLNGKKHFILPFFCCFIINPNCFTFLKTSANQRTSSNKRKYSGTSLNRQALGPIKMVGLDEWPVLWDLHCKKMFGTVLKNLPIFREGQFSEGPV